MPEAQADGLCSPHWEEDRLPLLGVENHQSDLLLQLVLDVLCFTRAEALLFDDGECVVILEHLPKSFLKSWVNIFPKKLEKICF